MRIDSISAVLLQLKKSNKLLDTKSKRLADLNEKVSKINEKLTSKDISDKQEAEYNLKLDLIKLEKTMLNEAINKIRQYNSKIKEVDKK